MISSRQAFNERPQRVRVARCGFTLLEVLVAVCVVALLAAILLPSLSRTRRQAERLGCANNLRTDGQALNLLRTELGRYPPRDPPPADPTTFESVWNVGNRVMMRLVRGPLGRPDPLYCPGSLKKDPYGVKPYKVSSIENGKRIRIWEKGHISYIYLVEIWNVFKDSNGQPTFDPELESPNISRSPRLVLIGDQTVELDPKAGFVAGSNHGREGGWFCFSTGDVQWWSWNRLTPHPARIYTWYWPRLTHPPEYTIPAAE